MALTNRQIEIALYRLPDASGTITTFDSAQVLWAYTDILRLGVGGSITPSGVLSALLTAYRDLGGGLTPTGDLATLLSAYRSLGGTLTPSGDMDSILTIVQALGGILSLSGELGKHCPGWLMIDKDLTWKGEWDVTTAYAIDDVVLYKSTGGNEWHVFISKITHNVGNIPTSTASAWRRLYQEPRT